MQQPGCGLLLHAFRNIIKYEKHLLFFNFKTHTRYEKRDYANIAMVCQFMLFDIVNLFFLYV
jgi:hypothetical protein